MAFCVGEIPRIFIMMMAIELGFLFKENASMVSGKRLTVDRLNDFYEVCLDNALKKDNRVLSFFNIGFSFKLK
jgi:hypothetical protein